MIEFVCIHLLVRIALRIAMVTMQFRKAQMCLLFRNIVFYPFGPKKHFGTNAKLSFTWDTRCALFVLFLFLLVLNLHKTLLMTFRGPFPSDPAKILLYSGIR